jgi:hypothetical protein
MALSALPNPHASQKMQKTKSLRRTMIAPTPEACIRHRHARD